MSEPPKVCSKCGQRYDEDVIFCPKDGTPLGTSKTEVSDDPYIGLLVAGQLEIRQLIGIGAMGRVYRAHQRGVDRDVAVKILHRELLRNPTVMARFMREAKVASRLTHPGVVQVLMTGELEKQGGDVGGEAYLAMEYLDGISLRSALAAAGGAMALPRALHVLLQTCDAVGEAHAQGIVHRDLKPENVMLVRRGDDPDFVKVLDFGVARIDWADSTVATQAGVIFGTARYISPEGAQGKPVSARSDVYSLAVMLYQCLSGQTPFDADSPVGILIKHTSEPAPDVRSVERASYLPEPIARVIAANLEKRPEDRCPDARDLGRALLSAARDSGLSADDLVARSTLIGKTALSLESIQRTKTLELSAGLADKLAGRTGPRTELLAEPSSRPAPSPPPSSRPSSGVEPTLADEPADARVSSPGASPPPSLPSSPAPSQPTAARQSHEPSPESLRASLPPPSAEGHSPPSAARSIVIAACFVLGALLAYFAAARLGVFEPKRSEREALLARAHAAFERGAFDAPPGENVRDITGDGLRRYPDWPEALALRKRAADRLRLLAEDARADRPADARELASRALQLDPDSAAARAVLDALDAASDSGAAPDPRAAPASRRPSRGGRPVEPAEDAAAAPPSSAAVPAPPPSATEGRWL